VCRNHVHYLNDDYSPVSMTPDPTDAYDWLVTVCCVIHPGHTILVKCRVCTYANCANFMHLCFLIKTYEVDKLLIFLELSLRHSVNVYI